MSRWFWRWINIWHNSENRKTINGHRLFDFWFRKSKPRWDVCIRGHVETWNRLCTIMTFTWTSCLNLSSMLLDTAWTTTNGSPTPRWNARNWWPKYVELSEILVKHQFKIMTVQYYHDCSWPSSELQKQKYHFWMTAALFQSSGAFTSRNCIFRRNSLLDYRLCRTVSCKSDTKQNV